MRKIIFIADESDDGKSVLSLLLKNKTGKRLITSLKQAKNGITLNGVHARTIDIVHAGDAVALQMSDEKTLEPNGELRVEIIYEDSDVVIFDKPAFMPVHPSHNHINDTLGNFFASHCDGLTFRPINRLDRNTSGLCVAAKNRFSALRLQAEIEKTYFAVVCGETNLSGTINAPISRTCGSIITRCVSPDGQHAVTHFKQLKTNGKYSLVKIKLETGRTHQIRVHFSHIGFPLAGDDMYGGDCSDVNRQALHCGEIEFLHPVSGEKMRFMSHLPQEISRLV